MRERYPLVPKNIALFAATEITQLMVFPNEFSSDILAFRVFFVSASKSICLIKVASGIN